MAYGKHDDEALLELFSTWEGEAEPHWKKQHERMDACYELVGGCHWDKEERETTESLGGVAPSFNRADPMVDAICGAEITNRQEITAFPREVSDSGAGESATNALRWLRDEGDMEDEESFAFRDVMIGGIGATDIFIDMEDPDDDPLSGGTIRKDAVDPRDYITDRRAKRANLVDREWQRRRLRFSLRAAQDKWPDFDFSLTHEDDGRKRLTVRRAIEKYEDDEPETVDESGVTIDEFQWFEKQPVIFLADEATNEVVRMEQEKFSKLQKTMAAVGVTLKSVKLDQRCYYRAYRCEGYILPDPDTGETATKLKENWFTTNFITGKLDRKTGLWYGVVWALIDPSKWANKLYGVLVSILNATAKGGKPVIEQNAVEDIEDFEASWADPTRVTVVKDGAISGGTFMVQSASPYPAGYHNLMDVAVKAIKEVAGVADELLGITGTDQAGVLEQTRIRQAYGVLSIFFNNLRRYRKESGRQLLKWLKRLPPTTLIRVDSEAGPQYMPLALDPKVQRYDLKIDESPMGPNQKERVMAALTALMPMLKDAGMPKTFWASVAKYLPLPTAMTAEIAQALQEPDPAAQKQAQLMEADAQAKIAKTQADAQLSQAKAASEANEGPLAQIEAQVKLAELEVKREEIKLKREELQLERERIPLEREQMQTDRDLARTNAAVSHTKARADIAKARQPKESAA